MELTEIIRTTLIIFTVLSSVYFTVSYGIFKYRGRKRVKPYLKNHDFSSPVVLLNSEDKVEEVLPVQEKIKRFHIVNENIKIHTTLPVVSDSLPFSKLRQKPVISYYSFNKNDMLQKLQTSRYAD
jgi:hypothetical protein